MPGLHPVTLDPALNHAPLSIRHIHFLGICGTGMGALAGMLKERGFTVTGSDQQVYPPMSDFLAGLGIQVLTGYRPEHLEPRPDLVVVGNVIRRDNPEAEAVAEKCINYLSFPQTLAHFFLAGRTPLVICGTHGKTTTSSLLATLLADAGLDPGCMIGGIVQAFSRNFRLGDGPHFVVEGDEYDTAFFDKGPKFLHYRPQVAVLTSVEFDHADIYPDFEAVKVAFRRLAAIVPGDGSLVVHGDDPVAREVTAGATCRILTYGEGEGCDWRLEGLTVTPAGSDFSVWRGECLFGSFHLPMPGRHNALNALAVIAVSAGLGLTAEAIGRGLSGFAGVRRRQEVRGEAGGVTVIDDFAHHPTAVRETLAALAAKYEGRRLVAVFEPRTNSSRRRVFQQDYAAAFDHASLTIVREPLPLAGLDPAALFSAEELARDLRTRGNAARSFPDTDSILEFLLRAAQPGDVIAILSNGGFDDIHSRLLRQLGQRNS